MSERIWILDGVLPAIILEFMKQVKLKSYLLGFGVESNPLFEFKPVQKAANKNSR